ncbi:MAG TPA: HD domain-containing phosphohydrolase [Caldimonas sp.]|jgi:putative nucleotidyltransferase with HDIG domain|nr:HD domain-containing phosphohydrolase [Caldimonas sp.]HEX2540421.1 HD domain-containing phosphohydrolase [Caldimonas sp.]
MKAVAPTDSIDVQALRVGMVVHLDVGWMSHPFPLSSFRITSAAQLDKIRALGLKRVRWSPQDSAPEGQESTLHGPDAADTEPGRDAEAANDPTGAGADHAATESRDRDAGSAAAAVSAGATPADGEPAAPVPTDAERARTARARRLLRQAEAERRCEQQYAEAARACRHTLELVLERPGQARAQAEALVHAVIEKMIGEQDLCVRMLTEGAGDKASMHSMNVGVIALLMGRCFGFSDAEMADLGVGALLHDVGKLEMPLRLRHRDDSFSPSEARVYEEHVELGVAQARRLGLSAGAAQVIAQHHEHADASGFPARLNSDRMTMAARIVALVNRYDNLCNPHLLARALTPHESLSLLFAHGRSKYDASILNAFIRMMGVYPPGSVVQLTDDRYALVVAVNSSRPLKPSVLVHDPDVARADALVLELEAAPGLGIRRSIRPQQLPPTALAYLAPTARVAYFFEPSIAPEELP